jgi:putative tryptophan/tyrosine transport system substrate-binding protein
VEARFAETSEGLPALAAELVQLKVDVIVVVGGAPADAARAATKTIPIVLGASPDLVEAGFVASLSRPGGNITGMSRLSPESTSVAEGGRSGRNASGRAFKSRPSG